MIAVSDTYAPFTPVREIGIRIRFGVIDVSAKPGVSVELGVGDILGGDGAETVNDTYLASAKYASLERNLWLLDGAYDILPDDLSGVETGFWSDAVSDTDGLFSEDIWIHYAFSGPVSTIGWSLLFDRLAGQYPELVRAVVYDAAGAVMADETFDTAAYGASQYIPYQIADYYAVRFYFNRTNEPGRRIRLVEVDFGLSEVHDANTIGEASFTYGLDLTSETLPARELSFTFDNSEKKYNLLDPAGIYEYLQRGQPISAVLVINGEEVDMGEFTFSSATTSKNVLVPKIRGTDLIYALDREVFRGGSTAEVTLAEAVAAVIDRSDVEVIFGYGVSGRAVVLAIAKNTSRRDALRLLAQAARCAVWVDRHNAVHIEDIPFSSEPVRELTADDLYNFNGISVSEPVEVVEVEVANPFLEQEEPVVYTAGTGKVIRTVVNPCVAPSAGEAVAAWLLERLNRQRHYSVKNRCDPAVEIGDTIRIHDIYGNRGLSIVTGIAIDYNGGLSAKTEAVGI